MLMSKQSLKALIPDSLLCCLLVHVQPLRQHLDVDALMYPTVDLKDEQTCALDKVIAESSQEKVIVDDSLTLFELVLGAVKVVVYKQVLKKLSDGVRVPSGVRYTYGGNCNQGKSTIRFGGQG